MIEQFFNLEVMVQVFPYLLKGLWMTLLMSAILAPLGMALGLVLALASGTKITALRLGTRGLVNTLRAFPPLVLIIVIYSALPFLGIRLPALLAVGLALWLNCASYYTEVLRAGIESVSKGQMEAARSTGLSKTQALRYVVLPQAIRNVLPDLGSNTIEVVKATSLASVIGVYELLNMASNARSISYNTSPIVLAALMYLVFLLPAVRGLSLLQKAQVK